MNGSKWTVTTFHTTPPMPTYLAAFVVCDYGHISRIERGKEVSEGDSRCGDVGAGSGPFAPSFASGAGPAPLTDLSWFFPEPCHCSGRNTAERSAALPAGALRRGFYGKVAPHVPWRQVLSPLFRGPRCLSERREKRARGHAGFLKLRLCVVCLAYTLLMPAEAAALAEIQAG